MTFKEYMEKNLIHPPEFAVKHGFSVSSVYRYMNGERASRRCAKKIQEITGGQVTAEEMRKIHDKKS